MPCCEVEGNAGKRMKCSKAHHYSDRSLTAVDDNDLSMSTKSVMIGNEEAVCNEYLNI